MTAVLSGDMYWSPVIPFPFSAAPGCQNHLCYQFPKLSARIPPSEAGLGPLRGSWLGVPNLFRGILWLSHRSEPVSLKKCCLLVRTGKRILCFRPFFSQCFSNFLFQSVWLLAYFLAQFLLLIGINQLFGLMARLPVKLNIVTR